MARFCLFFCAFFIVLLKESSAAAIFDAKKCDNGCKSPSDCPVNAHCVAVTQSSDCGLCLCQAGYRTEDSNCVPNDKSKSGQSSDKRSDQNSGNGGGGGGGGSGDTTTQAPDTSTSTTTSSSAAPTTTTTPGTTTQGAPPGAVGLQCSDYACQSQIQSSSDSDNPFTVRAQLFNESSNSNCKRKLNVAGRPCKMDGGGTCYGVYCLPVEGGKEYCICDLYRVDRQCAVDKPGNCESGTGQLLANAYRVQSKRYRNKNSPDNGSIYGRHFAKTFDDCVKLCQWSGGACKSINYGTISNQPICELLSVTVTKGSPLAAWLVDAPGWQHAQVGA